MLHDARPICFVATRDPSRARAFYEGILGLTCEADEPWALVFDLAGTMLRVQKAEELHAQPFTVLGWHVEDIAKVVAELSGKGVRFERYNHMQQDELGVWRAPSGARVAWFRDPDRNLLSLTQFA
ncbi:MAG: VOC family protein [Myxococcota bacterium]